jgi:ABC-type multidrug transport system fused ATPase/permease subunit
MLTNLQLFLSNLLGIFFVYFLFGTYLNLIFLLVVLGFTMYFLSSYFQLSIRVNKLDSELIIPINSKYSEMLDGLPTIRAYRKTAEIIQNYWQKMNIYSMAALVRQIVDGKLKLLMLSATNFLACLEILLLLFISSSYGNYTVFLIFNYFGLEDCIIRFYVSLNAFAPRLESLAKCEELTNLNPEDGYKKYLEDNWAED